MPVDLIDTSILVDVFRGNVVAARALERLRQAGTLAVPDVVLAELLVGCRGVREMRRVASFVKTRRRRRGGDGPNILAISGAVLR